jgi:hypothetical protein
MAPMTMEDAIAYCVRKGFGVQSESPGRVTMVKGRLLGRTKVLLLTEEDGVIYYTGRTGRRRFPTNWWSAYWSQSHF